MAQRIKQDYLVRGTLEEQDPIVAELIRHETARQARTIIMVPSESTVPQAVREAVGSAFHNIYAEGYPPANQHNMREGDIVDYGARLADYRRNADQRYYKGTEYANLIESLAQQRAAEVFATAQASADDLYVNVQPLSGAPANNAVYTALLQPGDTIMSMDLVVGGHLSHGARVNRSGKQYNIVSYAVNPETEVLDYERMLAIAKEHRPKILIGGYSSYPIAPDWDAYRAVADAVGAILLADVAHFAGLIAADAYPSPVGIADIVTFTTHKTLNGPRGACIITHRKDLAKKLDRGVFPGEQGGPHVNNIAGLAVALGIAKTDRFRELQHQTVKNARRLATKLSERGLRIPHGGTDSHMLVVDLKPLTGADGTALSGDMAARILDLIGVVCNRQTIPGDTSALHPSGIRLGLPWITQRGATEETIDQLGEIIADVLYACRPFSYTGRNGARAKIDFDALQTGRLRIRQLIDTQLGIDTDAVADGYPHFAYIDDRHAADWLTFRVRGPKATNFLQAVTSNDVATLIDGDQQPIHIFEPDGERLAVGFTERINASDYLLHLSGDLARTVTWLRSVSDGFVIINPDDLYARVPGPVDITVVGEPGQSYTAPAKDSGIAQKPFFIGQEMAGDALPEFTFEAPQQDVRLHSVLFDNHQQHGARMGEFAGYSMPLWYDSVLSEHLAVRNAAGVFDVTHMGVFDLRGAGAEAFLHLVTANDVERLKVGDSHYTFFLRPNGQPIDDLLIYRLQTDHFLLVVNASNNDENWAWLNAVKEGAVRIDSENPARKLITAPFELRDLRAASSGEDRRVDIALQGPTSRDILLQMEASDADKAAIKKLRWAGITRVTLDGMDVILTRTGYTGERIAYELFPHPEQAPTLFDRLIELGATPCGLAARDSLRIEAGLPLYGHELAGPLKLNPADAGMGGYVKLYKPFFIGKSAFADHEARREAEITRFRMDTHRTRPAQQGDPVVDAKGRVVGIVTSCSIDRDGYQVGQVYLKRELCKAGTTLAVFARADRARFNVAGANIGDRTTMPEAITILRRFPKR